MGGVARALCASSGPGVSHAPFLPSAAGSGLKVHFSTLAASSASADAKGPWPQQQKEEPGQKDSEGLGRTQKELEGLGRTRKDSEGIGRTRKELEGLGRTRKELEGLGRTRKELEGPRTCPQ